MTKVRTIKHQVAFADLRQWIEEADKIGELRRVDGATWQEDIGLATELLQHDEKAPTALFDNIPGLKLVGGPGTGIRKKEVLVCGDSHTRMRMELEAFDLVDFGDGLPYTRRTLSILNKISKKPGIAVDKIIKEFDDQERDEKS